MCNLCSKEGFRVYIKSPGQSWLAIVLVVEGDL